MKLKRVLAFTMAAIASSAVLAGCAASSKIIYIEDAASDTSMTNVSFFGFKADDLDFIAIENIMRGFMDNNANIQINYEGLKGSNYWTNFELRSAAGCLDDVIMMDQEHAIKYWDDLAVLYEEDVNDPTAVKDNVINLDVFNDLVNAQILKTNEQGTLRTVRYVPMTLASYCMYINYDLLKAHGKSVPTNYIEFSALCDYFKEVLSGTGLAPIICNERRAMCTLIQGKSLFEIYRDPQIVNAKMDEFNADPAKLAAQLNKGFDFLQTWFENGWIDPAATVATAQTSADQNGDFWHFAKGQQPFLISGGWAPQRLRKLLSDSGKTMNFGVHPYPIEDDGCVLVMDINNCVAINKNSNCLDAAKKFVAQLTEPDSIWEYCDGQACFSPLTKEFRIPGETAVEPTREYYTNGRAVIGTNYQLKVTLDKFLMDTTRDMCKNMSKPGATIAGSVADAKTDLLNKLTGSKGANA